MQDYLVIGEFDRSCDICDWRGSSSELVEAPDDDRFQNPQVFVDFMRFLQKQISPQVGKELVRLGMVSNEVNPGNIKHITELLIGFSKAGFESVLKGVLNVGRGEGSIDAS